MKNPNGYGTVIKLSGKRRKPFAAIVTTGWDDYGNQQRQYIGYFATRKEALDCLAEYNQSPQEFSQKATFSMIYEGWHKDNFYGEYKEDTERNYRKAFSAAKQFHNRQFTSLRLDELQQFTDTLKTNGAASRFKSLVNQMSEWAILRDYATKNYAQAIVVKQHTEKKTRDKFSDADAEKIYADNSVTALILTCMLYTGCRCMELLELQKEDCHLDEKYFYVRESKTENGVRIVPLHNRILPIFKQFYNEYPESPYVFNTATGEQFTYTNWKHRYYDPFAKAHNINLTTHSARHYFISKGVEYNCNLVAIKKIVGHATAQSLTEKVYTHLDIGYLLSEINKIP